MSRRYPEKPLSHQPWPSLDVDPADPFADPDHADLSKAFPDYQTAGGSADEASVLEATRACRRALAAAWRGEPAPELPGLAAWLLLDHPRDESYRHYVTSTEAFEEADLARIATDMVPAIANDAADRLLGPWAAVARPGPDARLLQIATAAGCFLAPDETPFDARHQWSRRKPNPSDADRAGVRAVAHAAFTAYPIVDCDLRTGRWALGDGVGGLPAGPALVPAPASLPGMGPPRPGDTLLARVVVLADDRVARLPIVAPGPVPEAAEAWLDLLLLEHRLLDRRAGPRDVLRRHGHTLVRRVLEAAWIR
jgi:hypothetical protein